MYSSKRVRDMTNLRALSVGTCSGALLACFVIASFGLHAMLSLPLETSPSVPVAEGFSVSLLSIEGAPHERAPARNLLSTVTSCDYTPYFKETRPTISPLRITYEVPSDADIESFTYATDQQCTRCTSWE